MRDEAPLAIGWVAAQSEDVFDAGCLVLADLGEQVVNGRVATGQGCHRQQPGLPPNALDQADGAVVATAPAGAVGHRDEGGLELAKRGDGGEETGGAVVVLGREELEREERLPPGE